jgi:glyoxylase-like metal-dependent hydrolase (beta-lactamase superfamily II)
MTQPQIIDTKMHDRRGITGAFFISGEQTALVETGPKSSIQAVSDGLERLGVDDLDWIIVTHVHLDHAGAAGTLAHLHPNARVAVHHVGAPHLVDPSKLWSSAARIYGDQMKSLWGGIDPIEEDRLVILHDGDVVDLGGPMLRAVDTPGHARHHHAFLEETSGLCFVGDALGVRLQDVGIVRPATPPPEFNLEDAVKSIERIRELDATSLMLTHYGASNGGERPMISDEACDAAIESLRRWESFVRDARRQSDDLEVITEFVRNAARAGAETQVSEEGVQRMEQTTSYEMNVSGYMRYLEKREKDTN